MLGVIQSFMIPLTNDNLIGFIASSGYGTGFLHDVQACRSDWYLS